MENPFEQKQSASTRPSLVSRPRRPVRMTRRRVSYLVLIALIVFSGFLLYWFVVRPFITANTSSGGYRTVVVAFSPDGHTLAAAQSKVGPPRPDHTTPLLVRIVLWDVSSGNKLRTLSGSAPLAFSPDGHMLASDSLDTHAILLWNIASGALLGTIATGHQVGALAFSPDDRTLASGSPDDQVISLWDAAHGTLLHTLSGHSAGILSLTYSRDGSLLASASSDQTIKLWDTASGKLLRSFPNPSHDPSGGDPVLFSPDGRTLVSVIYHVVSTTSGNVEETSFTGHLVLWSVSSGTQLRTLPGVEPFAFSPDGRTLVSGSQASTNLIIWNITTGKQQQSLFTNFDTSITSVDFSPTGSLLACSSDPVEIWNMTNGQLLRTLT